MNRRRLGKIKQQIEAFRRRGSIKSIELESLAKNLGRVLNKRGKEPTWVNENFPELYPLSIPHHGSRDLNRFTAGSILDQLENDLERWERAVESQDDGEGD